MYIANQNYHDAAIAAGWTYAYGTAYRGGEGGGCCVYRKGSQDLETTKAGLWKLQTIAGTTAQLDAKGRSLASLVRALS